jgi:hypothetical protein
VPLVHCESVVQVPTQVVALEQMVPLPHGADAGHEVEVPLQVPTAKVEPPHWPKHGVGEFMHDAPPPQARLSVAAAHAPFWQVAQAPVAVQLECGSVLLVTLAQVPLAMPVSAAEQALQAVLQSVSQQKPSTHELVEHW